MLDFTSKDALKNFADQLTQCIKASENGDILIDSNKINPKCLHLTKKPIIPMKNAIINPHKILKKYDKKRLLAKTMKFIANRKYFLIANYIERPIKTAKNVMKNSDTEVFEDYEALLEIIATNFSNESFKIQWEMAEKDAIFLGNTSNIKEAAKEILDKITIIGLKQEKFLYSLNEMAFARFSTIFSKEEFKNVVFLKEKALKILQNKIKSRKFLMNYKRYRKEIMNKKLIIRGIFKIASEKSLIYLFENKPELEIVIFDLKLFNSAKIMVNYSNYDNVINGDKRKKNAVLAIIESFILLDSSKNLHYDEKECLENLKKYEDI